MDWLMNGKGEMFTSSPQVPSQNEAGEAGTQPTLFSGSGLPIQPGFMEHHAGPQQMSPQTPNYTAEGKLFDKPARRIAEIRVFYDDGTFETFSAKQ